MKILIVNKSLQVGGAEQQLVKIATYLHGCGHKVSFLLYEKKGDLVSTIEEQNISIYILPSKGLWGLSRYVRDFIKKGHYDSVVSFLPECNLLCVLASLPIKKWRLVTGARSANPNFLKNRKLHLYYYSHIFSDKVISNSETNKKDILHIVPWIKNKIEVVYNIIEPLVPISEDCFISQTSDKISLGIIANYREVKNLKGFLLALSSMPDKFLQRLTVHWYGAEIDDSKRNGIQFIKDKGLEGLVNLHGPITNLSKVYQSMDVIGLFSHYEGLPNSICEALMFGKPVICTPVSDLPYILRGSNNIICDSSDSYDIMRALENLLSIDKSKLLEYGKENKNKYSHFFDETTIKEQVKNIICG